MEIPGGPGELNIIYETISPSLSTILTGTTEEYTFAVAP